MVNNILIGAIAGDIIGSAYEFNSTKNYEFILFSDSSEYTDDTVMTVANADWLLSDDSLKGIMLDYGNRYSAGYGGWFIGCGARILNHITVLATVLQCVLVLLVGLLIHWKKH